jgi:hypothetical protein
MGRGVPVNLLAFLRVKGDRFDEIFLPEGFYGI